MPDVTGVNLKDAKKMLNELGLEVEVQGELLEEAIVKEQLPKKGIEVNTGTKVTIYTQ